MTDADEIDDIADLESRIEALAETAERCRKFVFASKLAIGAGVALLLAVMLGLIWSGQAALWAIALVLLGIVSLGSNLSTLRQTTDDIGEAEALRASLIGAIDLRVVRQTPTKLM